MSKSNFQLVAAMNAAFGNVQGDPGAIDWARLKSQIENIKDEYKETTDALALRDLEEVRDGLCDIMVFAYGAFHFLGIDADRDMRAVIEGVMTRFCRTQDELDRTKAKYDDLVVKYYVEGEFPAMCLKSAEDQQDRNGENLPKGKFLKSVGYRKAVFPDVGSVSAELPAYQQRVIDEEAELDDRLGKLREFMTGPVFACLPTEEQALLLTQRQFMTSYAFVLGERIARFGG